MPMSDEICENFRLAVSRLVAEKVAEQKERDAKIAEDGPELDDSPPFDVLKKMVCVPLTTNMQAASRATKKSIAAAIRSQHA